MDYRRLRVPGTYQAYGKIPLATKAGENMGQMKRQPKHIMPQQKFKVLAAQTIDLCVWYQVATSTKPKVTGWVRWFVLRNARLRDPNPSLGDGENHCAVHHNNIEAQKAAPPPRENFVSADVTDIMVSSPQDAYKSAIERGNKAYAMLIINGTSMTVDDYAKATTGVCKDGLAVYSVVAIMGGVFNGPPLSLMPSEKRLEFSSRLVPMEGDVVVVAVGDEAVVQKQLAACREYAEGCAAYNDGTVHDAPEGEDHDGNETGGAGAEGGGPGEADQGSAAGDDSGEAAGEEHREPTTNDKGKE